LAKAPEYLALIILTAAAMLLLAAALVLGFVAALPAG
jgi:hypothetical protein